MNTGGKEKKGREESVKNQNGLKWKGRVREKGEWEEMEGTFGA